MKIQIIYDNKVLNEKFVSGWGFSCLVDERILFDTGDKGDDLLKNMAAMNIDVSQIEKVVISHDHWDHTGGLWDVIEKRKSLAVYGCPGFSSSFKKKVLKNGGRFIETGSFQEISDNVFLTGGIPGRHKLMSLEEQAIVVKTEKGLTVVTGCAHPGIVTILEIVKEKYPIQQLYCVLGGFHLINSDKRSVEFILQKLDSMGVQFAGPAHCSGDEAIALFKKSYGNCFVDVRSGALIEA